MVDHASTSGRRVTHSIVGEDGNADRARQPRRAAPDRGSATRCAASEELALRDRVPRPKAHERRIRRRTASARWPSPRRSRTSLAGSSSSSNRRTRRWPRRARPRGSCSAAILLALLVTVVVRHLWGRSFIRRIFALTRVTRSLAEGKLDTRVALSGRGRDPRARRRVQLDGRQAWSSCRTTSGSRSGR